MRTSSVSANNAVNMKKTISLLSVFSCLGTSSYACPLCNRYIREAIYNSTFYPNLFFMLSAFIVLGVWVVLLVFITTRRHRANASINPAVASPVPLATASAILGIGLGGFVDGIVLHQILQVHEMLSNKVDATNYIGKSVNMFWDGIFHLFCFIVVCIGIYLLWRLSGRKEINRSGRLLVAGLLGGWGLFNLTEGIIDHQLLRLHNVVEYAGNHNIGNYGFLVVSVLMLIGSYGLYNSENRKAKSAPLNDKTHLSK